MEGIHTFLSLCEYCLSSLCSLGILLTALKSSVGDDDDNNNNNNNNNLQLGYHPVAVVILHVHKYGKKVTR